MLNKIRDKGITLIALIITIIVLLILAGIAISQLTGSGLFGNAKLAKEKYENAQKEENEILDKMQNILEMDKSKDKLSNIDITTEPLKLYYYKGETIDLTGMIVTAYYTSGKEKVLFPSEYTTTPENGSTIATEGIITVTIKYMEKTAQIQLTVIKATPESAVASSESNEQPISNTYDGLKETYWDVLSSGSAEAIYTFNKPYSFKKIRIYLGSVSSKEFNETISIYGSNNISTGYTEIATSRSITQQEDSIFDITDTSEYKYIKIAISNGMTGWGSAYSILYEVEFFTEIIEVAPLSAEASFEAEGRPISNSYDNSKSTFWDSYPNGNAEVIYAFDKEYSFRDIEIYLGSVSSKDYSETISIYGSNDKTTGYTEIATSRTIDQRATSNFNITNNSKFKYIKIVITDGKSGWGDNSCCIYDIKFNKN